MREEFITYVKEQILHTPNYASQLDVLKNKTKLAGATDAEFAEALSQVKNTQPSSQATTIPSPNPKPTIVESEKDQTPFTKRLLELDLTAHIIIGVILIVLVSFLAWSYLQNASIFQPNSSKNNVAIGLKDPGLVSKVYANSIPVDPNEIFSIPASSITLAVNGTPKKNILGFFPYWMLDDEDKVSLNALTTISLFGLTTNSEGNIITSDSSGVEPGWAMWNNPKLNDLLPKAKARGIKVLVTIKNFNNADIEHIVTNDAAQKIFIANVIYLTNERALDGVNIDFEYTGTPDSTIRDNFTRLMTNLNTEMKRQSPASLLTIDTYVTSANNPDLFDLPALSSQVDAFVIMGYDFHTPSGSPGPVAPLEGQNSILTTVDSYLDKVPANKLILAVPYYGYDWNTSNSNQPATVLPYVEASAESQQYTINWDDASQTPWYSYVDQSKQTHQVYFDNVRSLGEKYDLVNNKNLQGVGIWALGYDGLNSDLRELLLEKFAN